MTKFNAASDPLMTTQWTTNRIRLGPPAPRVGYAVAILESAAAVLIRELLRPWLGPIVMGAALSSACAHARPAQSWSELTPRLRRGSRISVTESSGATAEGRVASITPGALEMDVAGTRRTFTPAGVREVREVGDPLWNGFAIGAGVGVLGAALSDNRCIQQMSGSVACTDRQVPQRDAFFGLAAGAGLVIDALHRQNRVVYRAPSFAIRGHAAIGTHSGQILFTIAF
jgi:hypothetical protein